MDIRPVTDLRNKFADLSKTVHESGEPVFLTKNGYGDMVVMSIEAYERLSGEAELFALLEAGMDDVWQGRVKDADVAFAEIEAGFNE